MIYRKYTITFFWEGENIYCTQTFTVTPDETITTAPRFSPADTRWLPSHQTSHFLHRQYDRWTVCNRRADEMCHCASRVVCGICRVIYFWHTGQIKHSNCHFADSNTKPQSPPAHSAVKNKTHIVVSDFTLWRQRLEKASWKKPYIRQTPVWWMEGNKKQKFVFTDVSPNSDQSPVFNMSSALLDFGKMAQTVKPSTQLSVPLLCSAKMQKHEAVCVAQTQKTNLMKGCFNVSPLSSDKTII